MYTHWPLVDGPRTCARASNVPPYQNRLLPTIDSAACHLTSCCSRQLIHACEADAASGSDGYPGNGSPFNSAAMADSIHSCAAVPVPFALSELLYEVRRAALTFFTISSCV